MQVVFIGERKILVNICIRWKYKESDLNGNIYFRNFKESVHPNKVIYKWVQPFASKSCIKLLGRSFSGAVKGV